MDLQTLNQLLKACGNSTRLRIINILSDKELMVKDICDLLKLVQPTLSRHLLRMRLLRLVIDRRDGSAVFYRLNQDPESPQGKILRFITSQFSGLETFAKDKKVSIKRTRYVKEVRDTLTGKATKVVIKMTEPNREETSESGTSLKPAIKGRI